MSEVEAPSWAALLTLMVHGPADAEPSIRGAIRSRVGDDESAGSFGWANFGGDPLPVVAGVRGGLTSSLDRDGLPPTRVWRDGARIRIEEPDGFVNLIVGDSTC